MANTTFFDAVLKTENDGRTSVVPSATVTVYVTGTMTLAGLFENDGSTAKTNPTTTDVNGNYSFRIADGGYDFRIQYAGFLLVILNRPCS